MSSRRFLLWSLFAIVLLSFTGGSAWADRDNNRGRDRDRQEYKEQKEYKDQKGYKEQKAYKGQKKHQERQEYTERNTLRNRYDYRKDVRRNDRNYVLDKRHRHERYYPRRGYVVKHLPRGYYRVPYRGLDYYFYDGIWYSSRSGIEFTVIAPPIGLVVPVLPNFYTTLLFGGTTYYYADGTYYRWYPERSGYIVVDEPQGVEAAEEEVIPDELFVYPRKGQSDEQIAKDRYECHRWAVEQTGFDPTKPLGGVSADQNGQKRSDYNRATKSCLEARGYSVQ